MIVPDLLDPDLIADPYTGFGRLREQAAVVKGRNIDGSPMWYVTRQTDVRTVLSDSRFVNDPNSVPGGVRGDHPDGRTTAHLISNGTVALLTHPDQLSSLHADSGLWPSVVHELMRWCGPVTATGIRYAVQDLELGGVRTARGEAVEGWRAPITAVQQSCSPVVL